jgi:hypothetical protein
MGIFNTTASQKTPQKPFTARMVPGVARGEQARYAAGTSSMEVIRLKAS